MTYEGICVSWSFDKSLKKDVNFSIYLSAHDLYELIDADETVLGHTWSQVLGHRDHIHDEGMNVRRWTSKDDIRMKLNKSSEFVGSLKLNSPVPSFEISHDDFDLFCQHIHYYWGWKLRTVRYKAKNKLEGSICRQYSLDHAKRCMVYRSQKYATH